MTSIIEAVHHARDVRAKLRNPPNAVKDEGIDLKRKPQKNIVIRFVQTEPIEIKIMLPQITMGAPIPGYLLTYKRNTNVVPLPIPCTSDIIGRRPSMATVLQVVVAFYGLSALDLISQRRTADIVRPRQIAMYLCRCLTIQSTTQIGKFFGGRDHTTIIHSFRKIQSDIKYDERLADEIKILKLHLRDRGFNCP